MSESTRPWDAAIDRAPVSERREEALQRLVSYAVMAPSTHNSQPWLFRVRDDVLELLADRSRALPIADPLGRELVISCGAAIQFAHLAARNFNFEGAVELLPDPSQPDLLARLRLGPPNSPTSREKRRFRAIDERHTSRIAMAADPIREHHTYSLGSLATRHGVLFRITRDKTARQQIADVVTEAETTLMHNPEFRKELALWIKSSKSRAHDGMSLSSFGIFDKLSHITSAVIDKIGSEIDTAAVQRLLVLDAPAIGVVASAGDDCRSWLKSGMALADITLELAVHGLSCSFFSQPLMIASARERLAEILDLGAWPQMLVRFGLSRRVPGAARRASEEVTITD